MVVLDTTCNVISSTYMYVCVVSVSYYVKKVTELGKTFFMHVMCV